jgi:LPS sulfotransferase NodH
MRCLFLLGAHRSGTTWLHQLLASSPQISCITYWDVVQQLHQGWPPLDRDEAKKALEREGDSRGFDGVAVGLDLPEEYGYLLEKGAFDMYTRRPISNTCFEPLQQLIAKKSQHKHDSHWLLMKNPVDFYDGFLNIANQFTDSKFIFLHRHPLAVFRSQVMAWRHLAKAPNTYLATVDPTYAAAMGNPISKVGLQFSLHSRSFLETMLLTLAESFDFHLEHENDLAHQAIRLRYEDLCRDPIPELDQISNWLGLADGFLAPEQLSAQPRKLKIDPLIQEVYAAHAHRFAAYRQWIGYSIGESPL